MLTRKGSQVLITAVDAVAGFSHTKIEEFAKQATIRTTSQTKIDRKIDGRIERYCVGLR